MEKIIVADSRRVLFLSRSYVRFVVCLPLRTCSLPSYFHLPARAARRCLVVVVTARIRCQHHIDCIHQPARDLHWI